MLSMLFGEELTLSQDLRFSPVEKKFDYRQQSYPEFYILHFCWNLLFTVKSANNYYHKIS